MAWRSLLSKNVQELRLVFDQASPVSEGVRNFLKTNYVQLKQQNPNFPILVREGHGVPTSIAARYDFGREKSVIVSGMTEAQVTKEVEALINEGSRMPRSTESSASV